MEPTTTDYGAPAPAGWAPATQPEPRRKVHPIRGFLWGILFGLGLTVVLVVLKVIPLDLLWMLGVLVAGVAFGVIWGLIGPAKRAKEPPPQPVTYAPAPAPPPPPVETSIDGDSEFDSGADSEATLAELASADSDDDTPSN